MRSICRREFLRLSVLATAGGVVAACAPQAPAPPPEVVATDAPAEEEPVAEATAPPPDEAPTASSGYSEAPMLAERVAAGELPPVEDRLPLEPKLVNELPAKWHTPEIGTYGGILRISARGEAYCFNNEPLLNTPGILTEEITPNIVKDYEVSADHQEFTFYMREGLRWSDGEPVTTEDVRFAVEDVLLNEELTPVFPAWLKSQNNANNTPMEVTIIDDYTFRIAFDKPYGGFPVSVAIAGWRNYTDLLKPAHYLKQFHKAYADAAELEAAIAADNVETWVQLFTLKDISGMESNTENAVGFPSLQPWIMKEASTELFTYERNPYYFKVDAAGNQLPYIDGLLDSVVMDIETLNMKYLAGEFDYAREAPSLVKMPLYRENEDTGGYRTLVQNLHVTSTDIMLNLTHEDPVWREVVGNKEFRQALNYAINREEIIDAVYYGYADLPSFFPTEFSEEKANELLDKIGMDQRDGEGFRLGPDGKTFVVQIETSAVTTDMVPVAELVVQYWNKVGVKSSLKRIDGGLWGQRNAANELQGLTWRTAMPIWFYLNYGQWFFGPLWRRWLDSSGKDGEEPPPEIKEYYEKVETLLAVPPEEVPQVDAELKQMLGDNVYFFLIAYNHKQPLIVNANLANICESEESFAIASDFACEQIFYKQ